MSPYNLKHPLSMLLAAGTIFTLISCNNSEGETTSSSKPAISDLLGGKELPQATTDSLYIVNYLKKEPSLKKHSDLMFLFYGERDYKLAWFRDNDVVPEAEKFLNVVNEASKEGLQSQNYRVGDIEKMLKAYEAKDGEDSSRLELQKNIDLALTGSYFNYASDFYKGRIDPKAASNVKWDVKDNKIKLHKALQTILKERDSTYPYYEFEALHAGYKNLRSALEKYRAIEAKGGWTKVDLGNKKSLAKGDSSIAVVALRKRLNPEQKINANDKRMRYFDADLESQVKKFQMLHGLKEDGAVGGNTLAQMNVPVQERINQIMINMERWRWIPKRMVPKSLDQKYIWVNIPEYKMYVYEDPDNDPEADRKYKEVLSMRVIVGKTMHSTPIFSDKLEYVVIAPYWNVPNSIVENEIKPAVLKNPGYLARNNMEVVTKEKNPKQVDPYSINWSGVTEKNFPYMVRQRPGGKNSLGDIKFLFPNEYNVYLHDTPADALFNQNQRDFSHGCVRLEKPIELGKYMLKDMPEWNENRIRETIQRGEETWVTLPKRVQVYIVYFTSWADENGNVHFRPDLYGHDKKLQQEYFG
jgi:L,D-transpeptidase YcbB